MIWGCQRDKNKLAQHKLADQQNFHHLTEWKQSETNLPNANNSSEAQSLKPDHKRESRH